MRDGSGAGPSRKLSPATASAALDSNVMIAAKRRSPTTSLRSSPACICSLNVVSTAACSIFCNRT
jgi:hypothetical protein